MRRLATAVPLRLLPALLAVLVGAGLAGSSPAMAGVANAGVPGASPSDPLVGLPWGNYSGRDDEVFPAYRQAQGENKRLLGLIALRPRVRWFGSWYSDAYSAARDYIDNVTQGDPNTLAQLAVFRVEPWEAAACRALPSAAAQSSYRRWIDSFAAGIGSARVALILQPDLPFASCAPHHSRLPLQLVAYAAQRFSALAHTSVYIDAGAGDWASVRQATSLLLGAGVRYARGFALNATHYDSTQRQIQYGAQVVGALARAGVRGRHIEINTAQSLDGASVRLIDFAYPAAAQHYSFHAVYQLISVLVACPPSRCESTDNSGHGCPKCTGNGYVEYRSLIEPDERNAHLG